MELQLVPVDVNTGERLELNPSIVKDLENADLTALLAQLKALDKLKKKAEEEVKKRLDEGQQFNRVQYGKQSFNKVLALDNKAKHALMKKYGWDSLTSLTLKQLTDKFGEEVEKDLEPYIVLKPKKQSIVWDK
ncbi:unknown [Lactococcus phage Q54]|uniref:Phage protein n=1 Tax=Lactococcus phage Q54 TaxID=382685 RepID=Q0GXW8_9CAUD|nr:hypothetical protein Q54_gp04 [Lactococcus phage Q54]ABF22558.1 unknown [Lactococcus phage Q54]